MQDHMHEENEHSHQTTTTANSQVNITDRYANVELSNHAYENDFPFYTIKNNLDDLYTYKETEYCPSVSVTVTNHDATCGTQGVASDYRHGDETRPKNMNVQWIMRVF